MHELQTAMDKHQALIDERDRVLAANNALLRDVATRDGRIEQLEVMLDEAEKDRDYYLRWSIEVTKRIFDIGLFVNETVNAARGVVKPSLLQPSFDQGRMEAILDGVEKEVMKRPPIPKAAPKLAQPRDLDAAE